MKRLGCLLVVALPLACSDGGVEPSLPGDYVLRTINGAPLPGVVASDSLTTTYVTASKLYFVAVGTVERVLTLRTEAAGVALVGTAVQRMEYRLSGDSIEMGVFTPCAPGGFCLPNDRGTLVGDTLRLRVSFYQGCLFVYTRDLSIRPIETSPN